MQPAGDNTAALKNFELNGNVLTANVELCWENHAEFQRCCEKLLQSGYDEIILDFSHVTFIFSSYLGTVGKLLADTAQAGKRLTIRIASNLNWLFEMVGFEKLVHIEVVP